MVGADRSRAQTVPDPPGIGWRHFMWAHDVEQTGVCGLAWRRAAHRGGHLPVVQASQAVRGVPGEGRTLMDQEIIIKAPGFLLGVLTLAVPAVLAWYLPRRSARTFHPRLGVARQGRAWCGRAGRGTDSLSGGKAGHGWARLGMVRLGRAGRGTDFIWIRRGLVWRGRARRAAARPGAARLGMARRG